MNPKTQRRTRRATVNLLVGETVRGQLFQPLLADVSEGGVLLECPAGLDMPRAHDAVVELMLPGVPEIIMARCRVMRDSVHGFFRRRALEFVNISPLHRKHLKLYVQRVCGLA
jgi:c-di-GMP-binding flagellar brake protein YcgR